MNHRETLRAKLEELLEERVDDLLFESLTTELLGADFDFESRTDKELHQDAYLIASWYTRWKRSGYFQPADGSASRTTGEPPSWWRKESDLVLETFRDLQLEALDLFGLERPLELATLGEFLRDQASLERVEGDPALLRYPVPARSNPELMYSESLRIFRGASAAEFLTRGGVLDPVPAAALTDESVRAHSQALSWMQARTQRLWRLNELAERMNKRAGFGVEQAVGFLLCDLRIERPWIQIRPGWFISDKSERWFFKIDVGTTEVSPEALAAAYGRFLLDFGIKPSPRRGGRDSRSILYEWVEEQRKADPNVSFPTMFANWSQALNADQLPADAAAYSSYKSMRSAYGQKLRELRAKGGAS